MWSQLCLARVAGAREQWPVANQESEGDRGGQAVLLGWEGQVASLMLLIGSPCHSCHRDAGVTLESQMQDTSQGNTAP